MSPVCREKVMPCPRELDYYYEQATEPTSTLSLSDIDVSSTDFWRRPWRERDEAFATLRREQPIGHYDEPVLQESAIEFPKGDGFYALTRHRDVAEATRHPEVFLSGHGTVTMFDLPPEMVEYFSGMISTDNPKHARLRRIVSNAFSPKNIQRVEESIERVADEVITRARRDGTGDFVLDIAAPYPLEHLHDDGRAEERVRHRPSLLEHHHLERRPGVHSAGERPRRRVLGVRDDPDRHHGRPRKVSHRSTDRRRASALVNAEVESEKLTQQELASFFVLLVIAGSETTRTALAHALHAFSEFPEHSNAW